jgi:murein DD-endopeptidase MepM/ murein hydrolase activator NlpD
MEKDPKEPSYTVLVVPDSGEGTVRQVVLTKRSLRKWGIVASATMGLLLCATVLLIFNMGRLSAHSRIQSENLTLRKALGSMERQMQEAEALLGRFRVYDSQLRDVLSEEILPGFGPLDEEEMNALGLEEGMGDADWLGEEGDPMEEINTDGLRPEDLRPVELWASEVQGRLALILRLMEETEPRVARVAEELEDLSALRTAFPQIWPVQGKLTSGYGYRRSPISRKRKIHRGIDVAAARGTPVYAVAAATVHTARYSSGYGRILVLDHGYGVKTRYAHNSSLLVRQGDRVEAGTLIATVGSTGQSTGPHLHFELLIDDQAVDPLDYLPR